MCGRINGYYEFLVTNLLVESYVSKNGRTKMVVCLVELMVEDSLTIMFKIINCHYNGKTTLKLKKSFSISSISLLYSAKFFTLKLEWKKQQTKSEKTRQDKILYPHYKWNIKLRSC